MRRHNTRVSIVLGREMTRRAESGGGREHFTLPVNACELAAHFASPSRVDSLEDLQDSL